MFFGRGGKDMNEERNDPPARIGNRVEEDLGWTVFRTSKDSEKQVVLDYMGQFGIELAKSKSGLYYVSHFNCSNFRAFQKMTNYRAKVARVGIVGVEMDDGSVVPAFTSLNDAYEGLKILYDAVRQTEGDSEF